MLRVKAFYNIISNHLSRSLKTVASGDIQYAKPPSYNYIHEGYPSLRFYDRGHKRFNDNTRVIAVEGNIGVGKAKVAAKLAEAFGFFNMKDVDENDMWLFDMYSDIVDLRDYNVLLPDHAKYYTTEMFWDDKNPILNGKPFYLQYLKFLHRFKNYCLGMCHLFNTGRGFVIERSPFSDIIFTKTFLEHGLISQKAYDLYQFCYRNTVPDLWKPHVIVYLRTSPELQKKIIKDRTVAWEKKACNFNEDVIASITHHLEHDYLKNMSPYAQIHVVNLDEVDLNNEDDLDLIVEQVAEYDLNYKHLEEMDLKFSEWRHGLHNVDSIDYYRSIWSSCHHALQIFGQLHLPLDMPEVTYSLDAKKMRQRLLMMDPRLKYDKGFNPVRNTATQMMFDVTHYDPKNYDGRPVNVFALNH